MRNPIALARFAETTATVVGDLAQNTRLSLVALTKGEGIASKALLTEGRVGASEGSVSFLSLDDPALIVAKAARELKDFGGNLWRAGTQTGDRHPAASALFEKADRLTQSYRSLDADTRIVEFTMKSTPSLHARHGVRNSFPLVDRAQMLDNLIPESKVFPLLHISSREAYLKSPWMKYVVKQGSDAAEFGTNRSESTARLLGFTETMVGRSRLRVHVPVMSEI